MSLFKVFNDEELDNVIDTLDGLVKKHFGLSLSYFKMLADAKEEREQRRRNNSGM